MASLQRSTCRYKSRKADDPKLDKRLRTLAEERPRLGCRRIHALLRREGWEVNRNRVYRTHKAARLAVQRRNRKRLRASRPAPAGPVTRPNERGSMDLVHADGRRIRTFNVVDALTRERFALEVDASLPSARVVGVLDRLEWKHGLPESVDNGPEFLSSAMDTWATQHGVKLDFRRRTRTSNRSTATSATSASRRPESKSIRRESLDRLRGSGQSDAMPA